MYIHIHLIVSFQYDELEFLRTMCLQYMFPMHKKVTDSDDDAMF